MRKSDRHNNRGCASALALALLLALAAEASSAQEFRLGREDRVLIRADEAWEDPQPGIIHFRGAFELRSRGLLVTAERATIRGDLDDPELVDLEGAPARLSLSRDGSQGPEPIAAAAQRIRYDRDSSQVTLEGLARVDQAGNELQSSRIEYDFATGEFRAAGETGVRLSLRPLD